MKMILTAISVSLLLGISISAEDAGPEKKVDLKLRLPTAKAEGTPVKVKVPNLAALPKKPRPSFQLPEGCSNVAAGKEVSSSDPFPIDGDLSYITDEDNSGSNGSWVELGPGVQWVQIDLESPHALHAIVVWHYVLEYRAYHDVIIQVSDDPDFVAGITTIYSNDHDNSSGLGIGTAKAYVGLQEGLLVDAKGAKGRYVRLYSRGNSSNEMNHYIEVEVHGKRSEKP